MSWITTIAYSDAVGRLKTLYDRVKGPDDNVDNIMMLHSLRPHTMEGHMAIYKYVLHHSGNTVPKWFLETIGVWVSMLNDCGYCIDHHFSGLKRLMNDDARADAIYAALKSRTPEDAPLDTKEKQALRYAQTLALEPSNVTQAMIADLRASGFDDGQILEINQVTSYFCYANRTVLGLGCSTKGDIIGLSPNDSDNPNDWSHS